MNEISIRLSKLNGTAKKDYDGYVESAIRERYSLSAEIAILRQRDAKPEEFAEYNEYVEECKKRIKEELGI